MLFAADLAARGHHARDQHAHQQDQARRTRPSPALAPAAARRARDPSTRTSRASFESRAPHHAGHVRSLGPSACNGSTRLCDDCVPDCAPTRTSRRPLARVACGACASSSSRTCTRRASGRRSGRSCAIRSRRCGGATISRSSCSRSARAAGAGPRGRDAAHAVSRPAVRHRPRALRADRLAGAARPARAGGRDAARQRPARAPLVRRHPRGAAVHGAGGRGVARVQREPARARASTRRVAVLPVGIDLERFRPIPRAEARERLGLDPDGPVPAVPARSRRGR